MRSKSRPCTAPHTSPASSSSSSTSWSHFLTAYSSGKWLPDRIPNNPASSSNTSNPGSNSSNSSNSGGSGGGVAQRHNSIRASFSSQQNDQQHDPSATTTTRPVHALQTTAATMRWAGSFVDISPLALPSPEHELTDPMRGAIAVVPGAHPDHSASASSTTLDTHPTVLLTPGASARPRLSSFWQGTTDVSAEDYFSSSHPPITTTVAPSSSSSSPPTRPQPRASYSDNSIPPARRTNLTRQMSTPLPELILPPFDYFIPDASASTHALSESPSDTLSPQNPNQKPHRPSTPPPLTDPFPMSTPPHFHSRPPSPKQYLSPFPKISPASASSSSSTSSSSLSLSATSSSSTSTTHPSPSSKTRDDHQLYLDLGYLVAPSPPDELERRRALYKFNIWNTGPDLNFSRIAHLAKLVFTTKGVGISLIDGSEQWFKSQWGFEIPNSSRHSSICAHTILQRGDEPMIILDTHLDWRFAKNPLVIGPPYIRFYAGAPLRTQDGHNIGTLMVIDDSPREEFSPRQRHTLKEFAAIAMREMELWKDKIQLRIRDRIQSSMEQFSRECLEIDTESQSSPVHSDRPDLIVTASMDRVYSRAAKLVKRTLDVEGVVVMDVSHCEVLESLGSAEGSVSVVMHRGECVSGGGGGGASGHGGGSGSSAMVAAATVHMTEQSSSVPIRDHWEGSGDSLGGSLRTPTASNTPDDDCVFIDSGGTSTPVTDSTTSHPQPPRSPHPQPHLQHPHHPPQPLPHPQLQPSSTGTGPNETTLRSLTSDEYAQLVAYFAKHPDGKISEGIVPPALRPFLPTRIQYALTVPIFNIDKRPFALLCAYNTSEHTKRYLEGHELSYLRAIGVIILSAVLKRRMILADKAKSLFISNISHELRTPLHGILAAAELLEETQLSHDQASFLQTVQACGTSLVETVNHVLDFTKLSGNSKSGGVDKVIVPSKVDLMQLVEEAVDGCWIGYRARTQVTGDSGIGSVYSPPEKEGQGPGQARRCHVETVVDIGYREGGWVLKCDKGGIRRVLMNLFGNSLKFTSDGYVHVVLRQVPSGSADPSNSVKIELGVCDTGKGISQNFLKNQLFHPFSQENPLQTGTGLGLAIVNNIVHSDSVSGKVDVWSEVGLGTEIKVTFNAELVGDDAANSKPDFRFDDPIHRPTVVALGFDTSHNGVQLLYSVLEGYITKWWGFNMVKDEAPEAGDVVILNDDPSIVKNATERRDVTRPFLILSASRGNPALMTVASEHERIGGICRILYKPVGPSRLKAALKLCLHALHIVGSNQVDGHNISDPSLFPIPRRNSEETHNVHSTGPPRPVFPRSMTAHPGVLPSWKVLSPPMESEEPQEPEPETVGLTISVGLGGSLLKSSIGTLHSGSAVQHLRVLVVEDNSILRNLLIKWLKNKGYDYRDAVDGRDGVNMFVADGPFDVVLLDLSMPVLDGFGATSEIRQIEATRTQDGDCVSPTRILALTGMSSLEDKRRAFDAGVDGYLVKPVAFKTLDEMFHKLGFS